MLKQNELNSKTGELEEGIVSVASMLNKNGYGTLYFGVKDNGEVPGQQAGDDDLTESMPEIPGSS